MTSSQHALFAACTHLGGDMLGSVGGVLWKPWEGYWYPLWHHRQISSRFMCLGKQSGVFHSSSEFWRIQWQTKGLNYCKWTYFKSFQTRTEWWMALLKESLAGPYILVSVSSGCSCTMMPLFALSLTAHSVLADQWPCERKETSSAAAPPRSPRKIFIWSAAPSFTEGCKLRQIAWKERGQPICLWCLRATASWQYVSLSLVVRNVLMFEEVGRPDEAGDSCASDVTASLSLFVTLQPRVSRNYCVSGRNHSSSKER